MNIHVHFQILNRNTRGTNNKQSIKTIWKTKQRGTQSEILYHDDEVCTGLEINHDFQM